MVVFQTLAASPPQPPVINKTSLFQHLKLRAALVCCGGGGGGWRISVDGGCARQRLHHTGPHMHARTHARAHGCHM